jgi:AbrB family looped-hinge helix DNA binding protein
MMKKRKDEACCLTAEKFTSRCRMESLIGIDERGQMVLPKELRERAGIATGDKFALISWEKDGQFCCFTLVKADFLADKVKDFLEPIMMTR